MNEVTVFAPVSIGNVGPCYDVLGYCLEYPGDFVKAIKTDKHRDVRLVEVYGPFAKDLKKEKVATRKNAVQIVAEVIWNDNNYVKKPDYGVDLVLHKYTPTRSGLGSSAVSCVATTKAMLELLGIEQRLSKFQISEIMIKGERRVSGHWYPDNVVPSYFGGFYIISHTWLDEVDSSDFYTVVLLQNIKKDTKKQRDIIDKHFANLIDNPDIPTPDKIEQIMNYLRFQSRSAARIVNGFVSHNLVNSGTAISESEFNFLEEVRGPTIKNYYKIKKVARDAGAYGCSMSGSGPSIFAITKDLDSAMRIKDAMLSVSNKGRTYWLISRMNRKGCELIDDMQSWISKNKKLHNFWG